MNYVIGTLVGALVGYFLFYKLVGCANGACPITSNKYASTIYGAVLGLLISAAI